MGGPGKWDRLRGSVAKSIRSVPRLEPIVRSARGQQAIFLDFPVSPTPRYGHGSPPHPLLDALIRDRREDYALTLRSFLDFGEDFARIPFEAGGSEEEPAWGNPWLPPLDSAALYGLLAHWEPRLFVEIGSGVSTRFARRAIDDHHLRTRLVSVDPQPRASCDRLCDEVIRHRLETLDLSLFERLEAGDVLFVDSSHRMLQNSDVTVLFLDILPVLAKGVRVHFHDICLPLDYPPDWAERYYSEQYPLAVLLLAGGAESIVLPNHFVSGDPDLLSILDPFFDLPPLRGTGRWGTSFWIQT